MNSNIVKKNQEMYVVAVSVSTGALKALKIFLDHIDPNSGWTFVIVQDVSPINKSSVSTFLSRPTKMQMFEVKDEIELEPNFVYVVPPTKKAIITGKRLKITDPKEVSDFYPDHFFHSLAKQYHSRAIAVILSESTSEEIKRILSIKRYGGHVLVGEDVFTKADGMIQSIIRSGQVDAILSPKDMGLKLMEIAKKNRHAHDSKEELDAIHHIFTLLHEGDNIDFGQYKLNTMIRRIERRMALCKIHTVQQYSSYMKNNPKERYALKKDLLIGVTQFFRDPEAFEVISEKVIPALFQWRQHCKEIRIWVAGCSTGEEAYSIAILFLEHMKQHHLEDYSVRIFATDIDQDSIQFAAQGIYPKNAVRFIPDHFVHTYFEPSDESYYVKKELREKVWFAPHNLLNDPPFSGLDLIACRNMLIDLQPDIQNKVLSIFDFALNSRGFLFLGPSETIGKMTHHFDCIDHRWNVFQHKPKETHLMLHDNVTAPVANDQENKPVITNFSQMLNEVQYKKLDDIYLTFMDEHLPPFLLVDENNDIVHLSGDLSPYLQPKSGKPSWNVYQMMNSNFVMLITTGIKKVRLTGEEVIYRSLNVISDEQKTVDLTIKPFSLKNKKYDGMVIVIFEAAKERKLHPIYEYPSFQRSYDMNQRILDLEQALQMTKRTLQATTEELKISNEELVAANEELQSTNKELQSVNEALITINEEYQSKIQELTELNNDMNNFLISTKIGSLFLDRNLCIRRFTPAITREIHVMEKDIGRPFSHISHHFNIDLLEDAKQVLHDGQPIDREIQGCCGRWYSMRVMPYKTENQQMNGVVFTFVDITELKTINEELKKLSYAIQQSPSIVTITDLNGNIEYVNPQFERVTGYSFVEVRGMNAKFLNQWEGSAHQFKEIWDTLQSGHSWTGELRGIKKNGETYWEQVRMIPIRDHNHRMIQILRMSENVTSLRNTEEMLRKSELLSEVGRLAAGIAHEIRNPLTALKGFTQLISSGVVNDKYIEIMLSELNRIEEIVSELLVLAKPQATDFKMADAMKIIHDVSLLLETQAILNKVDITIHSNCSTAPLECVQNQLKQVFLNLVKNSIEAAKDGGTIHIRLMEADGKWKIEIEDNGIGIPQEQLSRLGEPFYTTKENGSGLGLMVSYKIIEQHQGTLEITSEVGKGTCITITLPKKMEV